MYPLLETILKEATTILTEGGHRRTADVAAHSLKFIALIGFDGDACVQRKPGHVAGSDGRPVLPAAVWQGLQGEYFAPR